MYTNILFFFLSLTYIISIVDASCSTSNTCASQFPGQNYCCSIYGYCGSGSSYCGSNCASECGGSSSPKPSGPPPVSSSSGVRGLYYWTWSSGVGLGGTNLIVLFSGYANPDSALSSSSTLFQSVPKGNVFLGLGGGSSPTNAGHWTSSIVQQVGSYCSSGHFSGYNGLAFDVEEGDSGLSSVFKTTIATCRSKGFKILVTTSHSAPYGVSDAATLMQEFISDSNINYLSPQLYTNGNEGSNDYTALTVSWSQYASARAQFVPSIVTGNLYSSAQSYFKTSFGITTAGYVQWSQTVTAGAVSDSTTESPEGQSPLTIGLIVGGCCLGLIVLVVFVVVMVRRKKNQEIV